MGTWDNGNRAETPHRTIIIAHHLVWTAYGWWLPNDPRGSMSRNIASAAIAELGELHYGRKNLQPAGWVIRDFYERAEERLQHPLLTFFRVSYRQLEKHSLGAFRGIATPAMPARSCPTTSTS